ncbi:hypothetical protein L1987_29074 [Smallanthus sonchifolius]|uniref:Uncharacterized protein n=1 Tax=Smallanthus sonchifolius TaxID=185202 RepID=A0ACB9HZ19_9ASTR|nr:hypothetical protein L1987_29074 [Smallanthus sonchifolius]
MNPTSSSLYSTSSKRKRDPNSFDDEPNSCKRPKNDVFMNYSFEDIGKSFISHLQGALKLNSFAISDHTMLPLGQDMHSELLKAIEESEIYVLVFSTNYASSRSCLDELVDIMDRFHKFDERKVLPIFFKVDPSHVRNQQGPFLEAFQAHKTNVDSERVQEWRQALKEAGQLSGLTLQNGDEAKFVSEIVEELEKMQRPQELHVADHPVGIGSRAEELISTLRLDWKDQVLVVAVLGISGIGKTTIVKEVFNRIGPNFDLSCFLADIHYICQVPNWKVELPKALISCLTRDNKFSIMNNHNLGATKIRRLVSRRKVLLVLDDIDNFQQLESLGICPKWFYEGSRIIVTTRDKRSLGDIRYASYHTRLLNRRESLNLFTRLMFVRDDPVNTKFIKEVVGCAGGLPLVIKVWSCHFKQYDREQWPSILETLKGIPHDDVQKQLQLSYDSLPNRSKKLFLDIACFFEGMSKDFVVKVLQDEDSRFLANNEIQYLVDKSLVEITSEGELRMHHAILEMGREIVRQENEDEPGQRTRLWDPRDVMRVLTECSGTESVESIKLDSFQNMQEVTLDVFKKMRNLRLIYLYGDNYSQSNFSHDEMTHLCFKKLKYMYWQDFPFKSLDDIDLCNVVDIHIYGGNLESLWQGIKSLKKLRILKVSQAYSLTKTGNFSGLENLEKLYFTECNNLEELHSSIVYLQKLAVLDLRSSIPLERTPWEMIGKLASLRKLTLGNDHKMELERDEVNDLLMYSLKECPITKLGFYGCNISKISGGVVSLACVKYLSLDLCKSIQSIPNLPGNITSISAHYCSSLVNLPCNISELKSLTALNFNNCPKLGTEDPHFLMKVTGLTNLTDLTMVECNVSQVPSEIENMVSLKNLDLSGNTFSSLPDSLSNLSQLAYLIIEDCQQLQLLPFIPSNLTGIAALWCDSLDVMSSASIRTKVRKESPFSNRFMIQLPSKKVVPGWCSYQSWGNVLSFVAPVHLDNNICGIILCANISNYSSAATLKMHNKTKDTSHRFKTNMQEGCMFVMFYPLDDTTLLVEPGDSVVLILPLGSVSTYGMRLIYESDVVDCKLVIQTVTEHTTRIPSEMATGITQLNAISNDAHDNDYSSSDDEDELW